MSVTSWEGREAFVSIQYEGESISVYRGIVSLLDNNSLIMLIPDSLSINTS